VGVLVWSAEDPSLTFVTTLRSTFTLALPAPRADLTAAEVEAATELIISKNMFVTTGGELIGKKI